MNTIKITEIKNHQNYMYSKSGECASVSRVFYELTMKLRGRKPTWYYQGKKIIADITKDDIEEIVYCDSCGYQTTDLEAKCPRCGEIRCSGLRIKGTQHNVYADEDWNRFKDDFKKQFIHLRKFDYLRE